MLLLRAEDHLLVVGSPPRPGETPPPTLQANHPPPSPPPDADHPGTRPPPAQVWDGGVWLEWRCSQQRLRGLESKGRTSCKLSLLRAGDEEPVGYVMLDLRTAKMNARHGDRHGMWYPLMGTGRRDGVGPEVRLIYTFREDLLPAATAAAEPVAEERRAAKGARTPGRSARREGALRQSATSSEGGGSAVSAGLRSSQEGAGDPVRRFRFSVDLRSFKATRKLPFNSANCVFKMTIPEALALVMGDEKGHAALMAPLRTYPPTEVSRGSEASVPNGYMAIEFTCTAVALATLLANVPRLHVEAFHREKFASDAPLGAASVPLAALLSDPWIDGYAPVLALATPATHPRETVQVGAVRVIVAIEELGLAAGPADGAAAAAEATATTPARGARGTEALFEQVATAQQEAPPAEVRFAEAPPPGGGPPRGGAQPAAAPAAGSTEYQAAWEFEVWRTAEEARFLAEMKQKEVVRMQTLESEWRKHEKARSEEMAQLRKEGEALQAKLRKSLHAAEGREKKLLGAEEGLTKRRKELEREAALRATDAQSAIRRLQEECEHKLKLERLKMAEVARAKEELEAQVAEERAKAKAVEAEFDAFRREARASPEAQLQGDVARLQAKLAETEARLHKAQGSRQHYKDQTIKLARELARMHLNRSSEATAQARRKRQTIDIEKMQALAEQEPAISGREKAELAGIRAELGQLAAQEGAPGQEPGAGAPPPEGTEPAEPAEAAEPSAAGGQSPPLADEVRRLLAERAELLQTGVYKSKDTIIVALDERLQQLTAG